MQRRIRLIAQSSRRGKRSEEDQELITELSHQVEVAHDQAVTSVNNLANNLANNRQVARSQTVFRRQIVAIDNNFIIKSRQLTATVARREAEMAELTRSHLYQKGGGDRRTRRTRSRNYSSLGIKNLWTTRTADKVEIATALTARYRTGYRGSIFESGRLPQSGDPLGAMYAGSKERSNRSRRSRDRDDFEGQTSTIVRI